MELYQKAKLFCELNHVREDTPITGKACISLMERFANELQPVTAKTEQKTTSITDGKEHSDSAIDYDFKFTPPENKGVKYKCVSFNKPVEQEKPVTAKTEQETNTGKEKENPCLSCNHWNPYGTGYCKTVQLCVGYNAYEPKVEQEKPSEAIAKEEITEQSAEESLNKIRTALALLNSMVLCGENHSNQSTKVFYEASQAISYLYASQKQENQSQSEEEMLNDYLNKNEAKDAQNTGVECYLSKQDVLILMKRYASQKQDNKTLKVDIALLRDAWSECWGASARAGHSIDKIQQSFDDWLDSRKIEWKT